MSWELPDEDTYFAKVLKPNGFEIDHLEEALKYCTNFRLAVDGGAHIGTWSAYMANRFDRVVSFEPARDSYRCLLANLQYCENVIPVRAALGAKLGRCLVLDDPSRPGNTGARTVAETTGGTLSVAMDPLDWYDLKDLDFLKLDVEGYEVEALKGALETIKKCKPTIMVECKNFTPVRYEGPAATIRFLNTLGYREVGGIRNDKVFVHHG